jgi:hypothetical protein
MVFSTREVAADNTWRAAPDLACRLGQVYHNCRPVAIVGTVIVIGVGGLGLGRV